MFKNTKEALKYVVKIEYRNDGEGTGVLLPLTNTNYSYILTAKHTFGKDDNEKGDDYYKISISDIQKDKIELSNSKNIEFEVLNIIDFNDIDQKIDLLIIKIKNDSDTNKLTKLTIFEDEFTNCLAYGYPKIAQEAHTAYEPFKATYKYIGVKNKFEIRLSDITNIDDNLNTYSLIQGMSGGGVFVENHKKTKVYLAGILIKSSHNNNLVALNIKSLINNINESLKNKNLEKLIIDGAEWKDKYGFDMSDLDFEEEIKEIYEKEKNKNKFIKELNQSNDNKDKFIEVFNKKIKNSLKEEANKVEKIVKVYLYLGMTFHQFKENGRATHYFNKAIEFGGKKNETYLLNAKNRRKEQNDSKIEKEKIDNLLIEQNNSLYEDIFFYEKEIKENNNDSFRQALEESYRSLIFNLEVLGNNSNETIEYKTKLINLLDNSNKYEDIQNELEELKSMIALNVKFIDIEKQVKNYQNQIKALTNTIKSLTGELKDKKGLNKIDNINSKIELSHNKLDKIDKFLKDGLKQYFIIFLKKIDEKNKILIDSNNDIYKDQLKIISDNSLNNIADILNKIDNYPKEIQKHFLIDIENIIDKNNISILNEIKKYYNSNKTNIQERNDKQQEQLINQINNEQKNDLLELKKLMKNNYKLIGKNTKMLNSQDNFSPFGNLALVVIIVVFIIFGFILIYFKY